MGNAIRLALSRVGLAISTWRANIRASNKKITILIIGPQGSGKTTAALRLWKFKRTLPDLAYVPSRGFSTHIIKKKKRTIHLNELGGHPAIQELWSHYYADAHGLMYVMDATEPNSVDEAGRILEQVLSEPSVKGKPLLILVNKQDTKKLTDNELDMAIGLEALVNAAQCLTRVEACSVTDLKNDVGLFEGFRWIISYITLHFRELNQRVLHESLEEARKAKEERERQLSFYRENDAKTPNNQTEPSTKNSDAVDGKDNSRNPGSGQQRRKSPFHKLNMRKNRIVPADIVTTIESPKVDHALPEVMESLSTLDKVVAPASLTGVHAHSGAIKMQSRPGTGNSSKLHMGNNDLRRDSEKSFARMSPEGADSDEGIVNPAFEHTETLDGNDSSSSKETTFMYKSRIDRSPPLDERPAEIILVTTLAQVHEEQTKNRRASITTHDSVAMSIASLHSEANDTWESSNNLLSNSYGMNESNHKMGHPKPIESSLAVSTIENTAKSIRNNNVSVSTLSAEDERI